MIATAEQNCRILQIRHQTLAGIRKGKMMYFVDQKWITEQEFNQMFPVPTKIVMGFDKKYMKGEDVDPTRRWMHEPKN